MGVIVEVGNGGFRLRRTSSTEVKPVESIDPTLKLKEQVLTILNQHATEMEGDPHLGSNPGIAENRFDDVADEIVAILNVLRALAPPAA